MFKEIRGQYKDPSNERIREEVIKLGKFMEQEGRGFLFAPVPQRGGNHSTFLSFATRDSEDIIGPFWVCMLSIVGNMNRQIPEELKPEFVEGFEAFVHGSAGILSGEVKL